MADKNYTIRISTTADNSGTAAVSQGMEDISKKTTVAGESGRKAEGHFGALHRLFHSLNEFLPGLGTLMQAAFNPIGATISIAVMALGAFHEKMKALNEEFKKHEEEVAKPYTRAIEATRQGMVDAAKAAAQFRDRLADAARDEQVLQHAMEDTIARCKAEALAHQELDDALKSVELANLALSHKQGLLTDEQYYIEKLAIEETYAERKRAIEAEAAREEILAHKAVLEAQKAAQPQLEEDAKAAAKRAAQARVALDKMPSEEDVRGRRDETAKALKEFETTKMFEGGYQELIPDFIRVGSQATNAGAREALFASGKFPQVGIPGLSTGIDEAAEAWKSWSHLTTSARQAEVAFQRRPRQQAEHETALAAAEHDQAVKERRAEQNREQITENERADNLRQDLYEQQKRRTQELNRLSRETAGMQAKTEIVGAGGPLGQLEQAADVLAAGEGARKGVNPVKGPTPQQAAAMGAEDRLSPAVKDLVMLVGQWQDKHARDFAAAAAAIRAKEGTTDGQVALLESIVSHQQQLVGRVDALSQQLAALARIPFSQ
jgi:hypothetical protein